MGYAHSLWQFAEGELHSSHCGPLFSVPLVRVVDVECSLGYAQTAKAFAERTPVVSMQVADAGGRAPGHAPAIKVVVADVRSARPLVPVAQVDGFRAVHDADNPPALGVIGEGGVHRAGYPD